MLSHFDLTPIRNHSLGLCCPTLGSAITRAGLGQTIGLAHRDAPDHCDALIGPQMFRIGHLLKISIWRFVQRPSLEWGLAGRQLPLCQ
jgi:hypothetical protein